jgi:hypothetical protein
VGDALLWAVVAVPPALAFGGAVFFFVRDRGDDVPVAHMESSKRRTRGD